MTRITTKAAGDLITSSDMNTILNKIQTTNATNVDTDVAFARVFNVKNYGAVGDASTNDAAAFQATINAVPSRRGIVYVPSGSTFAIGATVNLKSDMDMIIDGTLRATANTINILQGANIERVHIYGKGTLDINSKTTVSGILFQGSDTRPLSRISIYGLRFINAGTVWPLAINYSLGATVATSLNSDIVVQNVSIDAAGLTGTTEAAILVNTRGFLFDAIISNVPNNPATGFALYGYNTDGEVHLRCYNNGQDMYAINSERCRIYIQSRRAIGYSLKFINCRDIRADVRAIGSSAAVGAGVEFEDSITNFDTHPFTITESNRITLTGALRNFFDLVLFDTITANAEDKIMIDGVTFGTFNGSTAPVRYGSGSEPTGFIKVRDCMGYNPVGQATFTINNSPFIYTNNDWLSEFITVTGGTLSSFVKNGITSFTATPCFAWLEPREAVKLVYTVTPSGFKDRK